jgi:hypothetical protein
MKGARWQRTQTRGPDAKGAATGRLFPIIQPTSPLNEPIALGRAAVARHAGRCDLHTGPGRSLRWLPRSGRAHERLASKPPSRYCRGTRLPPPHEPRPKPHGYFAVPAQASLPKRLLRRQVLIIVAKNNGFKAKEAMLQACWVRHGPRPPPSGSAGAGVCGPSPRGVNKCCGFSSARSSSC